MALIAPFKDGQFVQSASATSIENEKKGRENGSGIDSEAFLTLLVAEMQNQDPLEPTSNTEWISQYATFTQVSEVQAIGDKMQSLSAQSLVGQDVIMKVTNEAGNTEYVSGKVDYVVYENDDVFLSIEDQLYSIKDLDTVASPEYMEAYELASEIAEALKELREVDKVTVNDKEKIEDIYSKFKGMNKYQLTFLDKSVQELIEAYYEKLTEKIAEKNTVSGAKDSKAEENKSEDNNTQDTTSGNDNIATEVNAL